jgi:hypothetical protein
MTQSSIGKLLYKADSMDAHFRAPKQLEGTETGNPDYWIKPFMSYTTNDNEKLQFSYNVGLLRYEEE